MPVRFLGGGGGGGVDVRGIIATPTLTATSATTETVVASWQIPANYLLAKDAIAISLAGTTSLATNTNRPIYRIRIGTTGTTADTQLFTTMLDTSGLYATTTNAAVLIEGLIYFPSVGSSGTCYCGATVNNSNNDANFNITSPIGQQTAKTVNTTGVLYITITAFFASAGNTFTPDIPMISFSL